MVENILQSYPDIMTAKEVKEVLHIGSNTLYSLLNEGHIKSFKLSPQSRSYRILKSELIKYISCNSI